MGSRGLAGLAGVSILLCATVAQGQTLQVVAGGGRHVDAAGTTVSVAANSVVRGPDGLIYVGGSNGQLLRLNPASGNVTALPANGAPVGFTFGTTAGLAFDPAGALHVSAVSSGSLRLMRIDAATGTSSTLGSLPGSRQMVFAADGTMYFVNGGPQVYARQPSGTIVTIAGTTQPGYSGDFGPATQAQLSEVYGIAIGPNGDLFVSDSSNHRVRRISLSSGIITTVAGTGQPFTSPDGTWAGSAGVPFPRGVGFDATGNLYVGTTANILRFQQTIGPVTTIAGNGQVNGDPGDGGLATAAQVLQPDAFALDAGGNLFFADRASVAYPVVRRIEAATGIITRVVGNNTFSSCDTTSPAIAACLGNAYGIDAHPNGHIFVTDTFNLRVRRLDTASNVVAMHAHTPDQTPLGIDHDGAGNLYVASFGGYQVNRIDAATGVVTRVAGSGYYGYGGDNGVATSAALASPTDVAIDAQGNLYIADQGNDRIRKVDTTGIISTIANVPTPATVELDPQGRLVISGGDCRVRRLDLATNQLSTIAGTLACAGPEPAGGALATATNIGPYPAFAFDAYGNLFLGWARHLYRVDLTSGVMTRVTAPADGLRTPEGVGLTRPNKMEFDAQGNLYVTDTNKPYLFKVSGLVPDPTPPIVVPHVSGTQGNGVWYRSDVQVSWTVSDVESPVHASSGCGTNWLTFDTAHTTFTCSATSSGGTSTGSVMILRDATAPSLAFEAATPAPNAASWNNTDVSLPFSVSDETSGIASQSASPAVISGEGAGLVVSIEASDVAGNSASLVSPPINIDRTPPAVSIAVPAAGATYGAYSSLTANYSCSDSLSGISSCMGTATNGSALPTSTPGPKSLTVTATDIAGNATSVGRSYAVAALAFERFIEPMRRSPTFNGVTAGSLVPIRWRLLDGTGGTITNAAAFQSLQVFNLGCSGTAVPLNDATTGGAGLTVNPSNGHFIYNWQTDPSWAGTCKRVQVRFGDNTFKELVFRFQ